MNSQITILSQVKDWNDCMVNGVPTISCLEVVFGNILFVASSLVIVVLFVMFVIGSYKYLTSLGNAEQMEEARKTFTYSLLGLVLFLSSYVILFTIDILFLGGEGKIFELNFSVSP